MDQIKECTAKKLVTSWSVSLNKSVEADTPNLPKYDVIIL